MIIETRVFNRATGKMVYFKPIKPAGVHLIAPQVLPDEKGYVGLDESDPVMMKTFIRTESGDYLWEGDICEIGVITSFGVVKDIGVVVMRPDKGGFIIQINKQYGGEDDFSIVGIRRIGDIFQTPELVPQKHEPAEKLSKL
jgi:hypothetical protein